tara:strand:+ start:1998 stop:2225 length:228 start_codon:yes stop_codon:yes gene_type:complete
MKEFFYSIENIFVNYLLIPFDELRETAEYNWWVSNSVAWFFIFIGLIAFCYWMFQLRKFDKNKEEDMTITAHDYL